MLFKSLLKKINAKIDAGDEFLNRDAFVEAITQFQAALSLIPDPKHQHDISLQAYTALGEAYLFSGDYDRALSAFHEALKTPGGVENPLLHLRLGQAYFEQGEMNSAGNSLTIAYALDGKDVFDGEDVKYLLFLATKIDIDSTE